MANDILVFADDVSANVLTQAEYASDTQRTVGNQPGIARSSFVNKVLRQTSFISASLAQLIVDRTGQSVLDDGDDATLLTNMKNATDVAYNINSATAKTTPVDADKIGIWDSVSGLLNSVSWLNIKATLKTYFDTLYSPIPASVPRFSAYASAAAQAVTSGVNTKVQFNTEEYDITSAYDNATNYRFTPLVAGYYQVTVKVFAGSSSFSALQALLYKNGALFKAGSRVPATAANANHGSIVVAEVFMNGTTDYLEGYVNAVGTSPNVLGGNSYDTYFQANYKGV